jgi:perosamine synthetase
MTEPFLPYGRHLVDGDDIAAVIEALGSAWLTTGPRVPAFERALADKVGARDAVAVSSGTAALHCAMHALGIGPGDEVIVPALTFAATANCVVYQGATPVFADVDPATLLLDPAAVARRITPRTRAVVAVDYAGQPCDYDALRALTEAHGVALVADACHALGGAYRGRPVGSLADLSCFSFHPVKHITTGEGGAIVCDDPALAGRMRRFRNHGITTDHRERQERGTWEYEMEVLGYNYRLSDIQCALGISQLRKLPGWIVRRRALAALYDTALAESPFRPLRVARHVEHAYHLYVVRLPLDSGLDRAQVFRHLRAAGIGVNVHYRPVHLHPYYRSTFGTGPGLCPVAEAAYDEILTLPLHHGMADEDATRVIGELARLGQASGQAAQ